MTADPEGDAEARLADVMARGWATAPEVDLDAVLVGIASAVEAASPRDREGMRRRGARALCLLAEVCFEEREGVLAAGFPSREDVETHVGWGCAVLRALDAAVELDPHHAGSSEATLRVTACLESWLDVLSSRRLVRAWFRPRHERAARRAELEGVRRRRDRALLHLAALAQRPPATAPVPGPVGRRDSDAIAGDDEDRPTRADPRPHDDRPTVRAA